MIADDRVCQILFVLEGSKSKNNNIGKGDAVKYCWVRHPNKTLCGRVCEFLNDLSA